MEAPSAHRSPTVRPHVPFGTITLLFHISIPSHPANRQFGRESIPVQKDLLQTTADLLLYTELGRTVAVCENHSLAIRGWAVIGREAFSIEDSILLLIGERQPRFHREAAIRLFQFYTWMHTSSVESAVATSTAALLSAAAILSDMMDGARSSPESLDHRNQRAKGLISKLNTEAYGGLFDGAIAVNGGWTTLAYTMTGERFDQKMLETKRDLSLVRKRIEYQFRCCAPGANSEKLANHNRAMFFLWKGPDAIGAKMQKRAWSRHKQGAIFHYVSDRRGGGRLIFPFSKEDFVPRLIRASGETGWLRSFFGQCHYLASLLEGHGLGYEEQVSWLDAVRPSRLKSPPLLQEELHQGLEDYDDELLQAKFRNS